MWSPATAYLYVLPNGWDADNMVERNVRDRDDETLHASPLQETPRNCSFGSLAGPENAAPGAEVAAASYEVGARRLAPTGSDEGCPTVSSGGAGLTRSDQ